MSDLALATYPPGKYGGVPNIRDEHQELLHLEQMTPAGPRRRCHPHFAGGGDFATGAAELLIKLTDPQLRGPAAHWEGICRACRATLGIDDLLRALQARLDAPECRHGVSLRDRCPLCENALRAYSELGPTDVPIEGWTVLPFGQPAMVMPDQVLTFDARPQKIMGGPYRLGFHVEGSKAERDVYLQELKIGQCMLPIAWGEIWGWAFEDVADNKNAYERLLPLAGPCINLGQSVTATVHNRGVHAVRVSLVLFGHGIKEEPLPDLRGATGVPRAVAGASWRPGLADPGRPPQLPGNRSVRRPDRIPIPTGLDPGFYAACDDLLGDEYVSGDVDPDDRYAMDAAAAAGAQYLPPTERRRLLKAAWDRYDGAMGHRVAPFYREPPSGPVRELRETNPLEVLLDMGEACMLVQLKRGTALQYAGSGEEWGDLLMAWKLVQALRKQFTPGFDGKGFEAAKEPFVPSRLEIAGVQFEVRVFEPPPPPEPPPLSEGQLRYFEGRARDNAATLELLDRRATVDDDEMAWESPHDEWP